MVHCQQLHNIFCFQYFWLCSSKDLRVYLKLWKKISALITKPAVYGNYGELKLSTIWVQMEH